MRTYLLDYFMSRIATLTILASCSGCGAATAETSPILRGSGGSLTAQSIGRQVPRSDSVLLPRLQSLIRSGGPAVKGFVDPEVMAPGGAEDFISDSNNQVVYILNQRGKITATLTGFASPQGLAVDKSHYLYVANTAASDILVYAPPYNGEPKILLDPGFEPADVAVDSEGNVGVTNIISTSGGPGGVVFYAKGATSPTNTIPATPKFSGDFFCAFDADNNLYLDSQSGSGPFEVGEVVGGILGKRVTALTTGNLIQFPGGIQVTDKGLIAILDQGQGNGPPATIYTYKAPLRGSLGMPVATTPLAHVSNAVSFAFSPPKDAFTLTADSFETFSRSEIQKPNGTHIGQAQIFKYPVGGMPVESVQLATDATLIGTAINPIGASP